MRTWCRPRCRPRVHPFERLPLEATAGAAARKATTEAEGGGGARVVATAGAPSSQRSGIQPRTIGGFRTMRRDEIEQRREQKKHMMVELRSLFSRYEDAGKPWAKQGRREARLPALLGRRRSTASSKPSTTASSRRSARQAARTDSRRQGSSVRLRPSRSTRRSAAPASPAASAAEIPWQEFRSITWTGSVDNLNSPRRAAGALGYDQRYAYQALPSRRRRLGRDLDLAPDADGAHAGNAGQRHPGDRRGDGQAGDDGDADGLDGAP